MEELFLFEQLAGRCFTFLFIILLLKPIFGSVNNCIVFGGGGILCADVLMLCYAVFEVVQASCIRKSTLLSKLFPLEFF